MVALYYKSTFLNKSAILIFKDNGLHFGLLDLVNMIKVNEF